MPTVSRIPKTDREVTSIRLQQFPKKRLKVLAGEQGYLWQGVHQRSCRVAGIYARIAATATQAQTCALTGKPIPGGSRMYVLLPLSVASVE